MWLSGSYTQEYRLIGYTGHVLDNYQIYRIGNTSVNMSVYICLILFISIQKLIYKQNLINYSIAMALFICLLLTYSRSGLLAFLPGLILIAILNFKKKIIFWNILLIFGSIVFLSYFYNLIEIISNFGSIGKIIKYQELIETEILINPRTEIWTHGLNFIFNNPMTIIFGIGYGEKISEAITGIAFYES